MAANHTAGDFAERVTTLPPNKQVLHLHAPPPSGTSIALPATTLPRPRRHGRHGALLLRHQRPRDPRARRRHRHLQVRPRGPASHRDTDIVSACGGANLPVVDIAPGEGLSQVHRTCSVDFSICVFGVVKVELDGGEMLTLKPGGEYLRCWPFPSLLLPPSPSLPLS